MNQRQLNKIAAELGFAEPEVKSALLAVAESGIGPKDTVAALKSAIQTIKQPTEAQEEIMLVYSIGFFDESGNLKPLSDICDLLRAKRDQYKDELSLSYFISADGSRVFEQLISAGYGAEYAQSVPEGSLRQKMQLLSQEKLELHDQIKEMPEHDREATDQVKRIAEIDAELWKLRDQIEAQQKEAK